LQLADYKANDRKCSLLQFLIEQMAKNDEGLLMFYEELSHVEACCGISIKGLNAEIDGEYRNVPVSQAGLIYILSPNHNPLVSGLPGCMKFHLGLKLHPFTRVY
jgi:hypothetical protein